MTDSSNEGYESLSNHVQHHLDHSVADAIDAASQVASLSPPRDLSASTFSGSAPERINIAVPVPAKGSVKAAQEDLEEEDWEEKVTRTSPAANQAQNGKAREREETSLQAEASPRGRC